MSIPVRVTFQDMHASDALRADIEARARRLHRFAGDILSCNVVVRACERSRRHGNRYNVHATVMLRDRTIGAGRTSAADSSHEDPYTAAADTFDALRRRVQDHVRRRRGNVKQRARTTSG